MSDVPPVEDLSAFHAALAAALAAGVPEVELVNITNFGAFENGDDLNDWIKNRINKARHKVCVIIFSDEGQAEDPDQYAPRFKVTTQIEIYRSHHASRLRNVRDMDALLFDAIRALNGKEISAEGLPHSETFVDSFRTASDPDYEVLQITLSRDLQL